MSWPDHCSKRRCPVCKVRIEHISDGSILLTPEKVNKIEAALSVAAMYGVDAGSEIAARNWGRDAVEALAILREAKGIDRG